MIQIIVVTASVLLGLILYPVLKNTYTRTVTRLYRNLSESNKTEKEGVPSKQDERPSIIGKSKALAGHSRTKATTDFQTDAMEKKEHTFVPEIQEEGKEDAGRIDVDVPLEKIENPQEESIDPQEEILELESRDGAFLASGLSYDELVSAGQVAVKEQSSDKEKDEAGYVFYQHRDTLLLEQVKASAPELGKSIAALIDFHLAERAKENASVSEGVYPDDFKNFDIDSIF